MPFAQLSDTHKHEIIDGHADFYGIRDWFRWLETKTYRMHVRIFLAKYRSYVTCTDCGGSRLKAEALLTRIRGKHIAEVYAMPVAAASAFFRELAEAYRHDLWAMGYIVNGGCSDDGFCYFCCWLIGNGSERFDGLPPGLGFGTGGRIACEREHQHLRARCGRRSPGLAS